MALSYLVELEGDPVIVAGVVFVVAGACGFVPPLVSNGHLLGLFPADSAHNGMHLAVGLVGLVVARFARGR